MKGINVDMPSVAKSFIPPLPRQNSSTLFSKILSFGSIKTIQYIIRFSKKYDENYINFESQLQKLKEKHMEMLKECSNRREER